MKLDLIERKTAIDCIEQIDCKKDKKYKEVLSKIQTMPKADVMSRNVIVSVIKKICQMVEDARRAKDKKRAEGLLMALDVINDSLKEEVNDEGTGVSSSIEARSDGKHQTI